jgi:hypothetical protein
MPFTKKTINPPEPNVDVAPMTAEPAPIALVTLAAELPDMSIAELVARLGPDDVFIEPATGLRCVSIETCRRVIDEHHANAVRRAKAMAENEARLLAAYTAPVRADEYAEGLAAAGIRSGQR